jgi:hypothetical protein
MPQNRPSHQETAFQSGPSNPNYMYQTSTSSQNNVPNMTNNRQVYTGTIQGHQQLVQPYPQYVPNNHGICFSGVILKPLSSLDLLLSA